MDKQALYNYPETHIFEHDIRAYEQASERLEIAQTCGFDVAQLKTHHFALFVDFQDEWGYEYVAGLLETILETRDRDLKRSRLQLHKRLVYNAILHPDDAWEAVDTFYARISADERRKMETES